jgi:hypothetical protein
MIPKTMFEAWNRYKTSLTPVRRSGAIPEGVKSLMAYLYVMLIRGGVG